MSALAYLKTDKKELKRFKKKLLQYPYKIKVTNRQHLLIDVFWIWKLKSGYKRVLLIWCHYPKHKKIGKFFSVYHARILKKHGEQKRTSPFLFNFTSKLKVKKAVRKAVKLWCMGKWSAKNFDYEVIT